jgi:methylenetetrahydrofolate reductase (NADPH)
MSDENQFDASLNQNYRKGDIMKSDSNLEKVLTAGKFAVTAEIGPPRGADSEHMRKWARKLKGYADAFNITDCQTAIVRLSSFAGAIILLQEGLEPVMQMTCRDRNRIAMQSDILGASALGIKNILCLSGDHQTFGNMKTAKNVYDMDSIQQIAMFKMMRDECKDLSGEKLTKPPKLFIGAAVNPFADPFEFRVLRLAKKVNAGADFIQTQIIYDIDRFEKFMEMVRDYGLDNKVHILGGLTPLKSAKVARFMKRIPGLIIPDDVISRLTKSSEPKREGIKICIETIEQLKTIKGVHGVHIMAIAWEEKVPEIVEQTGLYPR